MSTDQPIPASPQELLQVMVDGRTIRAPFGLGAGAVVTGHDSNLDHPAWCSATECTADGDVVVAHHFSSWTTVMPRWSGDVVIRLRLYTTAYEPVEDCRPQIELIFDRSMSHVSLEGYEFEADRAQQLIAALTALTTVADSANHWQQEVPS